MKNTSIRAIILTVVMSLILSLGVAAVAEPYATYTDYPYAATLEAYVPSARIQKICDDYMDAVVDAMDIIANFDPDNMGLGDAFLMSIRGELIMDSIKAFQNVDVSSLSDVDRLYYKDVEQAVYEAVGYTALDLINELSRGFLKGIL